MRTAGAALAAIAVLALAACYPQPTSTGPLTEGVTPAGEPTVLASDLETPWSIAVLESGSTLISERDTALIKEYTADGDVNLVGEIPGVVPGGEGGLLGLAVADDVLYAYFTAADDNRVARMKLIGEPGAYRLGSPEIIVYGMPKAGNHNGGRIHFGPDGLLYVTAGDAGQPDRAQDVTSLGGKILRIHPNGSIPADNPFQGSPVYSLGHRNPQGIAWDDEGNLFAAEFGQNTWDEFNAIEAGGNYGWPVVEGRGDNPDYIDPLLQWSTDEASPSGLTYIDHTFFLAALRGESVWAIYVRDGEASAQRWFPGEHGRIRDVAPSPAGKLWLITSNTDGNGDQRDGADELIEYRVEGFVEG